MHALVMVIITFLVLKTSGFTIPLKASRQSARILSTTVSQPIPSGICAVYKPKDWSSHDVVQRLKVMLEVENRKRTGRTAKVKVGHGGTLDPIAEGVLVIGVGDGTKLMSEFLTGSKGYRAKGCFGEEYDTLDRTGKIVESKPFDHITTSGIDNLIPQFTGDIMQVPPMFSALKRDGETLYNLARQGIEVEREPRPVKVYSLSLHSLTLPHFEIDVECGGGFYIRTLISDMAKKLDSVAHMTELIRTKQGAFTLEDCLTSDNWTYENVCNHILKCSKSVNIDTSALPLATEVKEKPRKFYPRRR